MAFADTTARPHHRPIPRRAVASVVAVTLSALALTLLTALFLWPADEDRRIDVGSIDAFAPGTVTSFRLIDGRPFALNEITLRDTTREPGLHVVRLGGGELLALDWRSPHLGQTALWKPEMEWNGQLGFFSDNFSLWFMDGRPAFGPTPRGLDRYALEVTDGGRVIINLSQVAPGAPPPPSPWERGATATPASMPSGR